MQHDVLQIGYFPAYSGEPRYKFSRKFDRKISVSFDTIETDNTADYRVLVQCEPPSRYVMFKDMVYQHHKEFDLILTYDQRILELHNAREFIPVGTWVDTLRIEDIKKIDQISYIMSSKVLSKEHRMRFQILREVEKKSKLGSFDFIMHRSPPRLPNKNSMFINAKFHIACENEVMHNMFTEKIIDCFKTLTVPIYYGCINIDKYFNPLGILQFNSFEEFKDVVANITPDTYMRMLPHVIENHIKSRPYWSKNVYERIEDLLASLPGL